MSESAVPAVRVMLGAPAGVIATLAMDLVMSRVPEADTPPQVAASVLTGRPLGEGPDRTATVVHYVSGLLSGPLYVVLLLLAEGVVGGAGSAAAYGLSAGLLFVLMTGFFILVVLPRVRGAGQRRRDIGRAWGVDAAVYVVVVVVLSRIGALAVAAV